MKYCVKCGAEMFDDAVICVKCGCPAGNSSIFGDQPQAEAAPRSTGLSTAAKIFMIISTVVMALNTFGISLAWCLPMTISYCNRVKKGLPISTAFKVCTLIFVNTIAGILMLCDTPSN